MGGGGGETNGVSGLGVGVGVGGRRTVSDTVGQRLIQETSSHPRSRPKADDED